LFTEGAKDKLKQLAADCLRNSASWLQAWEQERADRYASRRASREPVGSGQPQAKNSAASHSRHKPGRGGPPARGARLPLRAGATNDRNHCRHAVTSTRRRPLRPARWRASLTRCGRERRPAANGAVGATWSNGPASAGYPDGLTQSGLFRSGKTLIRPFGSGPLDRAAFGSGLATESWRSRPSIGLHRKELPMKGALKAAAFNDDIDTGSLDDLPARPGSIPIAFDSPLPPVPGPTPPGRSLPGRPSAARAVRPWIVRTPWMSNRSPTPNRPSIVAADSDGGKPQGQKAGARKPRATDESLCERGQPTTRSTAPSGPECF